MRKGWELLVVWIGELARLAGHPLAEYRINQNAARALLRRAEALARRMLVIEDDPETVDLLVDFLENYDTRF